MFRSVLSVVAGIVVLSVASFAIEAALDPLLLWAFPQAFPNPKTLHANQWVMGLTYAYGLMCVAAGGYVAARLARQLPVRHAVAMGIVQAMLTVAAMFSPESSHASTLQWVLIAVLSVPAAVAGGSLYKKGKEAR